MRRASVSIDVSRGNPFYADASAPPSRSRSRAPSIANTPLLPYSGFSPPTLPTVRWRAALVAGASSMALFPMHFRIELLRERLGVPKAGTALNVFVAATALDFVGCVLGLLFQNAAAGRLGTKSRVIVALGAMIAVHMLFLVLFYSAAEPLSQSVAWIALGYLVFGCARGVAGTNCLSFLAAYGEDTQRFYALGTTAGWCAVGVIYFTLEAFFPASIVLAGCLHGTIIALCLIAAAVFHRIPTPPNDDFCDGEPSEENFEKFVANLRAWREWLPNARVEIAIYVCAAGCATFADSLIQLLYLEHRQTLVPGLVVSAGVIMIIFCGGAFLGATLGSTIAPTVPFPHVMALAGPVVGIFFVVSRVPALAVLCSFFSESGFTVACVLSSVAITTKVGREYTLTAMTVPLLMEGAVLAVAQVAVGPWSTIVGPVAT